MRRDVYLAAALVLSCAAPQKPQITDAADRIERDRSMDSHRKPVPMLAFKKRLASASSRGTTGSMCRTRTANTSACGTSTRMRGLERTPARG